MDHNQLWRELAMAPGKRHSIEDVTEIDPGRFIVTTKDHEFYGGSVSVTVYELLTEGLEGRIRENIKNLMEDSVISRNFTNYTQEQLRAQGLWWSMRQLTHVSIST